MKTELITKWEQIKANSIDDCEHKVDKLDIEFTLDALDITVDGTFKTIELSGKEFDIYWFKKRYLDTFKVSFRKEFPEYKFQFKETK